MIGRVALLVTFKKAKPKPQSLSRSHIRDLARITLTMKKIILLGIVLASNLCFSQENPFTTLKYDQIIAFEFSPHSIVPFEKLVKEFPEKIDQTKVLTQSEKDKIINLLLSPKTYGGYTAQCFDPHFALIFLDEGEEVAIIKVCISCNYLKSTFRIPAMHEQKLYSGTDYEIDAIGFSKGARKDFQEFLKEIGFTKYLVPLVQGFDM